MKKRILLVIGLLLTMTVLTGCMEYDQPITPESEGFWNKYIVYPLSWLIINISEFLGGNYGLGIIAVTLLIRFAILPLMIKQTKSSKAMQAIQPELKELQAKYSSKDQKTQQKLQQETMNLFQKHGVNPLAGCMPIFVQMPILIGLYHAFMRTREIAGHSFLWFELGSPDPLYVLPLLAGVTTFLTQKVSMAGMPDNPQMKMMLWMMPIMIVVFAFTLPSALSLYWVVGNIFSMAQTYFIKGPDMKKQQEATSTAGKAGGAKKK